MLAATLFSTIIHQYLGCDYTSTKLSYMRENTEIIKRLNLHKKYTHPYPNAALTAEFDLTEQIHLLHSQHELPSQFIHVKGHQDDHSLSCCRLKTVYNIIFILSE